VDEEEAAIFVHKYFRRSSWSRRWLCAFPMQNSFRLGKTQLASLFTREMQSRGGKKTFSVHETGKREMNNDVARSRVFLFGFSNSKKRRRHKIYFKANDTQNDALLSLKPVFAHNSSDILLQLRQIIIKNSGRVRRLCSHSNDINSSRAESEDCLMEMTTVVMSSPESLAGSIKFSSTMWDHA
jgi:hypothetical protein